MWLIPVFSILLLAVAVLALSLIPSAIRRAIGRTVAIVLLGSMFLAVALYGIGAAAKADEIRSVSVCDFDLANGEVLVEDEDGFVHRFSLDMHSWAIGQEFKMVIPDKGKPFLVWQQEGGVEYEAIY